MRRKIMIALLIFILAFLNYDIYQNEQIKKHGDLVLLELALTDLRSLMQGEYMFLHYAIANDISADPSIPYQKYGYLVILPDQNNVAQFVRLHQKEILKEGEKLLRFQKRKNLTHIIPNSFFFQEGHAQYYQNAQYGVFQFDGSDHYLLVGLADKNRKIIDIKNTPHDHH